jgi:hypothetical protein
MNRKKNACFKRKTIRIQFTFDTVPSHKEVENIILFRIIFTKSTSLEASHISDRRHTVAYTVGPGYNENG